jgi:hypothetical protein
MLRLLSRGMHIDQAQRLLRARAATGLELLADDVNTLLSAVVLCDPPRFTLSYLTTVKKAQALPRREDANFQTIVADAADAFQKWDTGDMLDLESARYMRSPEIHADKASARAAASRGEKRPRSDAPVTTAKEGSTEKGDACATASSEESKGIDGSHSAIGGGSGGAQPSSVDAAKTDADMRIESECFKELSASILAFTAPDTPDATTAWKKRRFQRALAIFQALVSKEFASTGPNARSFALMLHGAVTADEIDEGKRLFSRMTSPGAESSAPICAVDDIYAVLQPSMLSTLSAAGIVSPDVASSSLKAEKNTPKWFFLKAAYEATKGDQFGSKHGVVVTKDGAYLSHGHNHRFGVPGDKHLRVMHSEIHALVRLPSPDVAIGAEVWIVELDGAGIGYEEAMACIMCNKGLYKLGLTKQYFSSHSGVRSQSMTSGHKPGMVCESYEMARRRTYPSGTHNPDECDEEDFDFTGQTRSAIDPGRGRANVNLSL